MKDPRRERHHRQRVIHNRLQMASIIHYHLGDAGPGMLDKDRFNRCSCPGCGNDRTIRHRRRHAPRRVKQRTCNDWHAYEAAAEHPAPPDHPPDWMPFVRPGFRPSDWKGTADSSGFHGPFHDDAYGYWRPGGVKVGDIYADVLTQIETI